MLSKADPHPKGTITWEQRCQMLHLIGVAYNAGSLSNDDGHQLALTVMRIYWGRPDATTPGCIHGPWRR